MPGTEEVHLAERSVSTVTLGPVEQLLTIGEFAKRSLLSPKALRLYDRQGLLKPPHEDRPGHRLSPLPREPARDGPPDRPPAPARHAAGPDRSRCWPAPPMRAAGGSARLTTGTMWSDGSPRPARPADAPPDYACGQGKELRHVRDQGTGSGGTTRPHRQRHTTCRAGGLDGRGYRAAWRVSRAPGGAPGPHSSSTTERSTRTAMAPLRSACRSPRIRRPTKRRPAGALTP